MFHPLLIALIFPSIFFLPPAAAARSFCDEIAASQAGATFLAPNERLCISRVTY